MRAWNCGLTPLPRTSSGLEIPIMLRYQLAAGMVAPWPALRGIAR